MHTDNHHALAARLARVEGQLAAARAALLADDCGRAARTLLAASRALGSARGACVSELLARRVYKHAPVRDKRLLADVEALMKA